MEKTRPSSESPEFVDFRNAFEAVFRPAKGSRMFGSSRRRHQGFSDGHDGVQWNAGVDRARGVVTVGVNLEGMRYTGWPIARLIESERRRPMLPTFAQTYEHADSAELWFSRDAWQFGSRLDIDEQHFGPEPPICLRAVSEPLWATMLAEAYECLDRSQGQWRRARQIVTLSTGRREMGVSPHIQIKLVIRRSTDLSGLVDQLERARRHLHPVRELVQRQAADRA